MPVVFCHALPTLGLIVSVRKHRMLMNVVNNVRIWLHLMPQGVCLGDCICRSESWKSSMARPLLRTFVPETKMQSWKNQQVATDTHFSIFLIFSSSYTYTAVYCSTPLRHTGSHFHHSFIIFRHPSLPIYWASQGAESETNFGRYETVPEDGGQAIGIERFNCKFRGSQWVNGISFDLIWSHLISFDLIWSHLISFDLFFHHFPPFSTIFHHFIIFLNHEIWWVSCDFVWFPQISLGLAGGDKMLRGRRRRSTSSKASMKWEKSWQRHRRSMAISGDGVSANFCFAISGYIRGVSVTTCHNPEPTYPRQAFSSFQEWWNHLLNIKHGEPCELPEDVDVQAMQVGKYMGNIVGNRAPKGCKFFCKLWMARLDVGGVLGQTHKSRCRPPRFGSDLVHWIQSFAVWKCCVWTAQGLRSEPGVFGKVWEIRIMRFLHLLYPNCCWGIENKMYINIIYINYYQL